MTPNILDGMKFPFAVNDYVWFDIQAFDGRQAEDAVAARAEEYGLPEVLHDDTEPKNLPMPFEKFAVVRRTRVGSVLVTTYERNDNVLTVIPRAKQTEQICLLEHHGSVPPPNLRFNMDAGLKASVLGKAAMTSKGTHIKTEDDLIHDFIYGVRYVYWAVLLQMVADKTPVLAYTPIPNPANDKRIRKGKKPLFEWKIIDVTAKRVMPESSTPTGRTHASPRRHVRRGHQRKLPNGTTIWIKQMMVGKIEFGYIHHSYTTQGEPQ